MAVEGFHGNRGLVPLAAQLQLLQGELDQLQAEANQADQELATAMRAGFGSNWPIQFNNVSGRPKDLSPNQAINRCSTKKCKPRTSSWPVDFEFPLRLGFFAAFGAAVARSAGQRKRDARGWRILRGAAGQLGRTSQELGPTNTGPNQWIRLGG